MPSKGSPSPGGPPAHMTSVLFEVGAGRVRFSWRHLSSGDDRGAGDGLEVLGNSPRKDLHMDHRAVLVLDQIHHAGHRDRIIITGQHDTLGGDHRGVASFGQPRPDIAGLVLVVKVDLQVDHNCTAHGAHLLLDRSGTYLGLSSTGPRISSKWFSKSSSG